MKFLIAVHMAHTQLFEFSILKKKNAFYIMNAITFKEDTWLPTPIRVSDDLSYFYKEHRFSLL